MFNSRSQARWIQEQWRRNNEHDEPVPASVVEPVVTNVAEPVVKNVAEPVVTNVAEPVVAPVVTNVAEPVVSPVVTNVAEVIAANRATHAAAMAKYLSGDVESLTMPVPVHRQKATRGLTR